MSTETPSNKPTLVSRHVALVTALQAAPETDFALGGKTYPKATLLAQLSTYVAAHQAAGTAKQQWQKAVGEQKAALEATRPIRAQLKTLFQAKLGKTNPDITTYGFDPAKTPKRTVKTLATAVAKSKATRTARHTLGKKQKAEIKGLEPSAAPATPPTASTPIAASPVAAPRIP
jgi:hypothetical protein